MLRGQHRLRNSPHVALMLHAIANQIRDGRKFQIVRAAEFDQLRHARHRAVFVHDFANHARMIAPGKPRQIHASFRLPSAHQHAAIPRPQSVNVPRPRQILRPRIRIRSRQNSGRPIRRANPRRRPALGVDGLAEWGAEGGRVAGRNLPQVEGVAALLGEREADEAAAVLGHEVDGFGSDAVGGHRQVAFVFAVFVVDEDDHASLAHFFDGFFDRGKRRFTLCHLFGSFSS